MTTIRWSDMDPSGSYHVYEPGTYLVEMQSFEKKTASTGTPQLKWLGHICDFEHAGQEITTFTALTEKSIPTSFGLAGLLAGCGINLKGLPDMVIGSEQFYKVCRMVVGRKVYWQVGVKVYDGKKSNTVEAFTPYEEQAPPPGWDDDVPDFLKTKLKNAGLT